MSTVAIEKIALDAPTLVEASAGTGKTHAITTYFVRAILEQGLTPEQILVVTYTKAATAELRVRARKRISEALRCLDESSRERDALREIVSTAVSDLGRAATEDRLRKALGQMDQAAILTIHGFCQRLLQDYPLLFGIDFDFEVAQDMSSMYSELAVDFWSTDLYAKPDWLLHALISHKVTPEHLAKLAEVAMMPGIEILGPERQDLDEEVVHRWFESRREAGSLWSERRNAILEILREDPGLDRRSYRAKSIDQRWTPELDAFFREDGFRFPPEFFPKLAQGRMTVKAGRVEPEHPFFAACTRLCEAGEALDPMLRYAVFAFQRRFVDFARNHGRKRQEATGVLTFDDLLTAVYAPLDPSSERGSTSLRDRIAREVSAAYPLALVDEFQDTDSVQYGIFHAIYGGGAAVYVGDPKQAIYAFRGADVFSYIGAAADVGERVYALTTNRRSDPEVVRAINALFSSRQPPFILEKIAFEDAVPHETTKRSNLEPAMEIVFLESEDLEGPVARAVAPIVANEIACLLGSGASIEERAVHAGDVAVLCRSNNQAIEVTKELRLFGIPASLDGDSSVLNTSIASDLRAVLEATLMPGDSRMVRRALLTPLLGVSAYELATIGDETWSEWVSRFRDWNELWHGQGVLRFVEEMLQSTAAETRIASQPTARRELTDLLHLEELLLRGERERRRDPIALMQWFRRLDEGTPDDGAVAYEDLQQRPDAQSGAVRVSTIHKSKGLEYGIVYCPFTWNDVELWSFDRTVVKFHDEHGKLRLDLGSDQCEEHLRSSEREAFSEALRLLYVAVTRAKYRCTLFWGQTPTPKRSALGYLLHGDVLLSGLDRSDMLADVERLAASTSGAIGCRSPRRGSAGGLAQEPSKMVLRALQPSRGFDQVPRIASFSSLTGRDEKIPGPLAGAPAEERRSALFAELRGGARTGLLLHSILEEIDFEKLDTVETTSLIERELRGYGLDPSLAAPVQRDLLVVGTTPLIEESGAPRLIDLTLTQQLRELEFTLSVDRPSLGGLVDILARHRAPAAAPRYHERLDDVSEQTLRGFLRGYIDLVFEWRGRWYVADYKSNTLPTYGPDEVAEAVQREHYLLQALLYTAAAHRYLAQRVARYDPETHWGGALLLFLRGMQGEKHSGSSVFVDRQPAALLRAVDRWLGGNDESR